MGDLRNKFEKQRRDAEHEAWMAKHYPEPPAPQPLACCLCGWELWSRPPASTEPLQLVQVAIPTGWYRSGLFCTRCLPAAPGYEPEWDAMLGVP